MCRYLRSFKFVIVFFVLGAISVYGLAEEANYDESKVPAVEEPVTSTIGYHIREGKHDAKRYDWECFLDFADKHLKKECGSKSED